MITVIAHSQFRPEALDQVLPLYRQLVTQTRKEAGCLRYEAVQNQDNPGELTMVEKWESSQALEAHTQGPQFLALIAQVKPYALGPSDLKIYKEIV